MSLPPRLEPRSPPRTTKSNRSRSQRLGQLPETNLFNGRRPANLSDSPRTNLFDHCVCSARRPKMHVIPGSRVRKTAFRREITEYA